jgi:hypothetical protein
MAFVTDTQLAAPDGSGLVGFRQGGAGATARTVEKRLQDAISARDFGAVGGGVNDDAPALQAAIDAAFTRGGGIVACPAGTYALGAIVLVKAGVALDLTGSTIQRKAGGASITHLLEVAGHRAEIHGGKFVGTDMPAPTGPYSGDAYRGVAIYVAGSTIGVRIADCLFEGFPSGPILTQSSGATYDLIVSRCRFLNNQTYTASETNALIHFHRADNSRQIDCHAVNYNWKGFYAANGANNRIVRCHAYGGNGGNASHYITGDAGGVYCDNAIIDCSHSGTGFGFKAHNTGRLIIRGFFKKAGPTAGMLQGCHDFQVENILCVDPEGAALYIEGLAGQTTCGSVRGVVGRRATPGTTVDHVGLRIDAGVSGGGPIDQLSITDCVLDNMKFGIHVANSGLRQTNIDIRGNRLSNCQQYGILAFVGDGDIRDNSITMSAGATSAITVASDGVSPDARLAICDNRLSGSMASTVEVGAGFAVKWESINLEGNRSSGGTSFLTFRGNRHASDYCRYLIVRRNEALRLADAGPNPAMGVDCQFNATTATALRVEDNSFANLAGTDAVDLYASPVNVTLLGTMTHKGAPLFKAPPGTQYRRSDGGAGTSLYVKESAAGLATGWAAK